MRYSKIDFEHLCQFADPKFYEEIVVPPKEPYIPSASEKQLRVNYTPPKGGELVVATV